mmetsp:Transcript_14705/g.47970  ORF Transcript_14705/g.47970 Transcript_14705/m.47970 type:complete len:200 (-) Transcript_14705:2535-3134(-)
MWVISVTVKASSSSGTLAANRRCCAVASALVTSAARKWARGRRGREVASTARYFLCRQQRLAVVLGGNRATPALRVDRHGRACSAVEEHERSSRSEIRFRSRAHVVARIVARPLSARRVVPHRRPRLVLPNQQIPPEEAPGLGGDPQVDFDGAERRLRTRLLRADGVPDPRRRHRQREVPQPLYKVRGRGELRQGSVVK